MSLAPRGVYFLANDNVYNFTIAFLNSFRVYNPDIPLCLIPFDQAADRIIALKGDYDFDIYTDQDLLKRCDDISFAFHGNICGAYRKLAMWEGLYDEFIYIDVDTVVLNNINFAFKSLKYADIVTSHSNIPAIRKWVWRDTIDSLNLLDFEQKAFAANTGFVVSKNGSMPFYWMEEQVPKALLLKEHFELFCMEQPFLNYLIITSGNKYNSLYYIDFQGLDFSFYHEAWAGTKGGIVEGGNISFSYDRRRRFLIHWAGFPCRDKISSMENMPYIQLWKFYRNLSGEVDQ